MGKHDESQRQVDTLKVLDAIETPGVAGIVLARSITVPASESSYAGVTALTTVAGNDYTPFRVAVWYYDDEEGRWQSYAGDGYATLTAALNSFNDRTGKVA